MNTLSSETKLRLAFLFFFFSLSLSFIAHLAACTTGSHRSCLAAEAGTGMGTHMALTAAVAVHSTEERCCSADRRTAVARSLAAALVEAGDTDRLRAPEA